MTYNYDAYLWRQAEYFFRDWEQELEDREIAKDIEADRKFEEMRIERLCNG